MIPDAQRGKEMKRLEIGSDRTREQSARSSYSALRRPASPPSRAWLPPCLDEQTTAMPCHARIGQAASGRVNQKVAP